MALHNIALALTLPVLISALLRLNRRDTEKPTSLLVEPSGSGKNAPLTLNFTLRIGPYSIPVSGRRLVEGPIFEARRIPSTPRLFPSRMSDWLRDVLRQYLPQYIQSLLRHAFPVWFLPTRLIVKELDPEHPNLFCRELHIYDRLLHLQGCTIPIHYGTAKIEHPGETDTHIAHLLEFVDGLPLSECTTEQLEAFRSKEKIDGALALLSEKKVVQGDAWPQHFIHTANGALRIIDFGDAYVADDADKRNQGDARDVMHRFALKFANIASGPLGGEST